MKVLITGVTGQDGSWLSDLLLEKNYRVYGLARRTSTDNTQKIAHLLNNPNFNLIEGDILDPVCLNNFVRKIQPDEVYNLAAQSHVGSSFTMPNFTMDVVETGTLNLLEAVKNNCPLAKFYQASSSEMFGDTKGSVTRLIGQDGRYREVWAQNELTEMLPQSPYGIAKLAAHHLCRIYRQQGLFTCSGILFNHEGTRRGLNFVTRKITNYVGQLVNKKTDEKLKLGNLEARRDWGDAEDYVRGMWMMMQYKNPDDYVLATGETHTVREFCQEAFAYVGLDYQEYVETDTNLQRPAEVHYLLGDSSKARRILGWQPNTNFQQLVHKMVDHDVRLYGKEN